MWYRKTAKVDNVILIGRSDIPTYDEYKQMHDDLDSRLNASPPASPPINGERVPFGIDSTFYAVDSSLMACALLESVCAVITVNLKTRRRDQATLKARRTATKMQGQQNSRGEEESEEEREETGQ